MTTPIIGGGVAGTWIKCSEQLPMGTPYTARVLIAHHYHMTPEHSVIAMGWAMDGKWYYDRGDTRQSLQEDGFVISHWMPVPPVPAP